MHDPNCTHTIPERAVPRSFRLPSWIGRVTNLLLTWNTRGRQRHDLANLNDDALRDIGLTRADVRREISKPFWRA